MNVARAAEIIGELSMLKFFPTDKIGRTMIVKLACKMAASEEQIRWLVDRMIVLYDEWPGPKEMRACFCSKFRPADGIEANTDVYFLSDGIPSEKESDPKLLESKPIARLTAGECTKDSQMATELERLSLRKKMR